MAIKGMTDQQEALPVVGVLRKGAEKPNKGPGRDLEYFRFTSDDNQAMEMFQENYPGKPQSINVFLPYKTALENMDSWIELWVAGGLVYRSDGENLVLYREGAGFLTIDDTPNPKPDPKPAIVDNTGKRADGSQYVGRLSVIIPELGRLATVTALTTSKNDIIKLTRQLRAVEALTGDLRGVPFVLQRKLEKISTPGKNGKRLRRPAWMLTIETKPEWAMAKMLEQENLALPQLPDNPDTASVMVIEQLPANVVDPMDEIIEVDDTPPPTTTTPPPNQDDDQPPKATTKKSAPLNSVQQKIWDAVKVETDYYSSYWHVKSAVGQPDLSDPANWQQMIADAIDYANGQTNNK